MTKARSILEFGRLQNRKCPELWVESVRLEVRSGNDKLAVSMLAKALQVGSAVGSVWSFALSGCLGGARRGVC